MRDTASWVDSFDHVSRLARVTCSSSLWVPGPLSASMNLFAAVHADHVGARLAPGPEGATHAVLTPAQLDAHLADLAGLTVVVAGDRLSRALHDRARAAGVAVHHYYGAAELSFVAWGSHAEDLDVFPGVEVTVRHTEIWVRSPYLCTGYDGPAGVLRRDGSGYVTVGDHGRLVGDRLEVDGRPGSVTTGGATVLVADVERELRRSARGEVVVVAVPHQRLGSVLAAVLTDPGDHAPLLAQARDRLDPAARPRRWHLCAELPLTSAGKVDRAALVAVLTGADPPRRLT